MSRHLLLSKIDNIGTLTKKIVYVDVLEDKQKEFTIPIENFDKAKHLFEIRLGTVWFSEDRYDIVNNKVVLKEDEEGIDLGRRLAFVFIYIK